MDLENIAKEEIEAETIDSVKSVISTYEHGFETKIETEFFPKGISEEIVKLISRKNDEPGWMLDWRLKAYKRWTKLKEPDWAKLNLPPIDYQDLYYYAKPASMKKRPKSLDEVDPKLLRTYEKLGIPLQEQKILAGVEGGTEESGRKLEL